jgi:hypothetical protein
MRTFRVVVMLIGILVAVGIAGLAEAQTVGPLCATIVGAPINILVTVFVVGTGGGQLTMTGFDLSFNRPLGGSTIIQGNNSLFQMTLGATNAIPTLFVSGTVNLTTGNGTGICARNATNDGCGQGTPVTITTVACP